MKIRVANWLRQPAKRVTVVVLFLLLCLLIGLFAFEYENRGSVIHRDERNSCIIQARGLYANSFLAETVHDLHLLIARPLTRAQNRTLDKLPKAERDRLLDIYKNLNDASFNYAWVQGQQPKHRKC